MTSSSRTNGLSITHFIATSSKKPFLETGKTPCWIWTDLLRKTENTLLLTNTRTHLEIKVSVKAWTKANRYVYPKEVYFQSVFNLIEGKSSFLVEASNLMSQSLGVDLVWTKALLCFRKATFRTSFTNQSSRSSIIRQSSSPRTKWVSLDHSWKSQIGEFWHILSLKGFFYGRKSRRLSGT